MSVPVLLLDYLQSAWTLGTPSASEIVWRAGWYDTQYQSYFQVTCTPFFNPVYERYRDATKMNEMVRGLYHINVWKVISRGLQGSYDLGSVLAITREVCECFRRGFSDSWGGSLSQLGVALANDRGIAMHDRERVPRYFRYQVTVVATEHFTT